MNEAMCRVPLSAVITVQDGEAEIVSAEYQEVPADLVARFLMEKFGSAVIFGRKTSGPPRCSSTETAQGG